MKKSVFIILAVISLSFEAYIFHAVGFFGKVLMAIVFFITFVIFVITCIGFDSVTDSSQKKDDNPKSKQMEHSMSNKFVPSITRDQIRTTTIISDNDIIQKEKELQEKKELYKNEIRATFNKELEQITIVECSYDSEYISLKSLNDFEYINFSYITKKTNLDNLFPFVVIDVETTGLSPSNCEIIEISAIKFDGDFYTPISAFTTLLKPKNSIPYKATEVNHITNEMVADKPYFYQIRDSLNEFIKGCNIVGHNLSFDLKFLYVNGIEIPQPKVRYFDTLELAKHILKRKSYSCNNDYYDYDVSNYKLDTICNYYCIYRDDSHRSLSDCLATSKIFANFISYRKGAEIISLEDKLNN